MNAVNMVCPHCGHVGETNFIDYKPMAVLASNRSCFEDSDGRQLQRAGTVTCEECHEAFLYRLDIMVVCEVADTPNYYLPEVC